MVITRPRLVLEEGDELFNLPSVTAKVKRDALALNFTSRSSAGRE
jgi:hypothetical protein